MFNIPFACLVEGALQAKSHQAGLALGVWVSPFSVDVKSETIFSESGLVPEAAPINTVCPRLDLGMVSKANHVSSTLTAPVVSCVSGEIVDLNFPTQAMSFLLLFNAPMTHSARLIRL